MTTTTPSVFGKISFCDREAWNVQDPRLKSMIVQHMNDAFGIRIIGKHHDTVDNRAFLAMLDRKRDGCMMCLRSRGNPYFMYITRLPDGSPACIFIDKKIKPGHDQPRMVAYPISFHETVYDGTVVEGEMVRPSSDVTTDAHHPWTFMIHDVPVYRGWRAYKHADLYQRLRIAQTLIDLDYRRSHGTDPCVFRIKRYFAFDQLEEVVRNADGCRGIYVRHVNSFCTRDSLLRFDHAFDKDGKDKLRHSFWVFKTDKPDVYGMIGPSLKRTESDADIVNYTDTACVPSLAVSSFLRSMFHSKRPHKDGMLIPCEFDAKFEKWVPVAENMSPSMTSTKPTIVVNALSNDSLPRTQSGCGDLHRHSGSYETKSKTGRRSFESCLAGSRSDHCLRPLSDGSCVFGGVPGVFGQVVHV